MYGYFNRFVSRHSRQGSLNQKKLLKEPFSDTEYSGTKPSINRSPSISFLRFALNAYSYQMRAFQESQNNICIADCRCLHDPATGYYCLCSGFTFLTRQAHSLGLIILQRLLIKQTLLINRLKLLHLPVREKLYIPIPSSNRKITPLQLQWLRIFYDKAIVKRIDLEPYLSNIFGQDRGSVSTTL
jgi:hypothetical protein